MYLHVLAPGWPRQPSGEKGCQNWPSGAPTENFGLGGCKGTCPLDKEGQDSTQSEGSAWRGSLLSEVLGHTVRCHGAMKEAIYVGVVEGSVGVVAGTDTDVEVTSAVVE